MNENKIRASIMVKKEIWERFKEACEKNDRSASSILGELMKKYTEEENE
jgi:predicted DNA-binding protein